MFLIDNLKCAVAELSRVYAGRLKRAVLPESAMLRGPVGLFLVRPDGASGSRLAEEMVASFGYWNLRTGHYFDGVFLGWGFDGGIPAFSEEAFVKCINELESTLDWHYENSAHLLLTDFVYKPTASSGNFDFERTIPLNISGLLDDKKLAQLGPLMEKLVRPTQEFRDARAETSVMEFSDYQALLEGRRRFWQELVKKFGLLLGWVDQIAPYAVRDLRRAR